MVFSASIAACLGLHSVPDSGWHCLNCKDITGDGRGVRPIMIRLTRVDKEPEYEIGGCVVCRYVIWLFILKYTINHILETLWEVVSFPLRKGCAILLSIKIMDYDMSWDQGFSSI
jgi:hypothetical protein